jgi:hypothetical protein
VNRKLRCKRCGEAKNVEIKRFIDNNGKRKVAITCDILVHVEPVTTVVDDPDTPDSSIGAGGDSLVHDLKLYSKLIEAVYRFDGPVEYGVIEHEIASKYPDVYKELWERQGHNTTHPDTSYTLSTYLSSLLGTLAREKSLEQEDIDATVPWSTSGNASAWMHPERQDGELTTWADYAEANDIDPDSWPATADFDKKVAADA